MNARHVDPGAGNRLPEPVPAIRRLPSALFASSTVLAFFVAPAFVTTASAADTAAAAPDTELEEVTVTGSRIRGVTAVGSSIVTVGQEQIEKSASATISDLLKEVPQVAGFGFDETSLSGLGGQLNTIRGSSINLRGLGPQATLPLLDGRRFALSGLTGAYIDPNAIPTIAVERVEVVADGSSAIYGSDAIAGVVNFITRKSFSGLDTRLKYSTADGYNRWQGSVLGGFSWGSGGAEVALEHTQNSNFQGLERSYIRADLTSLGGHDYRGNQCNPGNILVGTTSYAIPVGGVTAATANRLVPGTRNFCDLNKFNDVLPEQKRDSLFLYTHQALGERVELYDELLVGQRKFVSNVVQRASTSTVFNVTLTRANNPVYFVSPSATAPGVTVQYFLGNDLGQVIREKGWDQTLQNTTGIEVKLGGDWRAKAEALYSKDYNGEDTRRPEASLLTAAANSSNPASAFNVFGGTNSAGVVDTIMQGIFEPRSDSWIEQGSLQADGSMFQMPGGAARLAVGAEYLKLYLKGRSRIGLASNPAVAANEQFRDIKSTYAEMYLPLVGAGNARGGVQKLNLSIAGRMDDYSDAGRTTNPKIGLNWQPIQDLTLSATYGRSFRAPQTNDLVYLRTGANLISLTLPDPVVGRQTTGIVAASGNPELKPETAKTYSFGLDWRPAVWSRSHLKVNYFDIHYTNQIVAPAQTLSDPNFQFLIVRNPPAAQIQALLASGITATGILPQNPAWLLLVRPLNLGTTQMKGLDFVLDKQWNGAGGVFTVTADGQYVLSDEVQTTVAAPVIEQVGRINFPVKLRGRLSLGYDRGRYGARLTVNHQSSYDNVTVTPAQRVSAWTTLDARASYSIEDGAGWASNLSVALEATNLTDRDPPFVDVIGGFDPGASSVLGRMLSLNVGKRW